MIEHQGEVGDDERGADDSAAAGLSARCLAGWVHRLAGIDTTAADAELIDRISELERLKSACAAAQAALTVAFVASRTADLTTAQARDERVHRSITAQVALARRDSPVRGGRHVGLAKVLTGEMPHAYQALRTGRISEWRATLLVRETACLSADDRGLVDTELADRYGSMGDRETAHAAMRIAQRLDPEHCVARHRKATADRRVSIRPAPDTMSYVSALLPVAHGVAVYAALARHAATARATGDPRSQGQLMADEFVTRITTPSTAAQPADSAPAGPAGDGASAEDSGPASQDVDGHGTDGHGFTTDRRAAAGVAARPVDEPRCTDHKADSTVEDDTADVETDQDNTDRDDTDRDDTSEDDTCGSTTAGHCAHAQTSDQSAPSLGTVPAGIGLDIALVMTDRTLFDGDHEPAILTGYGPIPADLARQLVRDAGPTITAWIRRLYTNPDTGHLISADTTRRTFTHAARQFLIARDQTCRTPCCDAPIRHADHITAHHAGGPTHITNGQGLCENCNQTKEAPGWTARAEPDGPAITITTPTGHTIRSDPPPPPHSPPWRHHNPTAASTRHLPDTG